MLVELQGDLITSRFWQEVRARLANELQNRQRLSGWRVVIRPRTQEDNVFLKYREKFNLSEEDARELDEDSPDYDFDKHNHVVTVAAPGESFPADVAAGDLAKEIAANLESLVELE